MRGPDPQAPYFHNLCDADYDDQAQVRDLLLCG